MFLPFSCFFMTKEMKEVILFLLKENQTSVIQFDDVTREEIQSYASGATWAYSFNVSSILKAI